MNFTPDIIIIRQTKPKKSSPLSLTDIPEELFALIVSHLSQYTFENNILILNQVCKILKFQTVRYVKNELNKIDLKSTVFTIKHYSRLITPQILLVGGNEDIRRCNSFNPITVTFNKCCSLSVKRSDQFDVLNCCPGVSLAISGNDMASVGVVELYDLFSNTWTELSTCHIPHALVALSSVTDRVNKRVYVLGGFDKQTSRRVNSVYSLSWGDIMTSVDIHVQDGRSVKEWTMSGPLTTPRSHHGSALLGRDVWIAGGFTGSSIHSSRSVEIYNLDTYETRILPNMLSARHQPRLFVINDMMYAVGGDMQENAHADLTTIEKFNTVTSQWEHVTVIPSRRTRCASCVYRDRVFVFGGSNGAQSLCSWDYFDIRTGLWASQSDDSNILNKLSRMLRKTGTMGTVAVLMGL